MSVRIEKTPFGRLPDGRAASLYTMTNTRGASVSITDFGGAIVSINVPDRNGAIVDVALGYSSVEGYSPNAGYLGALIGRVGNRIGCGRCTIHGAPLALAQNDGRNHLHGGVNGFDRRLWDAAFDPSGNRLALTLLSPDGDEGYPGRLRVTVHYDWSDDNALMIAYDAVSDRDTLVNLTNHVYFNLSGEGSGTVERHLITIDADRFTVTDSELIPTGEIRAVDDTPFDLRRARAIGEGLKAGEAFDQMQYGKGYDHNFCLNKRGMRPVVELYAPDTGIAMTVVTDQPGVQFYSGNMLEGVNTAKCGKRYAPREGLCLETQNYPDAINHANFPSPILRAGERYHTATTYRFTAR